MPDPIRIAAALIVRADGKALLVRKRGSSIFMLAGGKIAPGETAAEALRRELSEELSCGVAPDPAYLGHYSAPAANEKGRRVEAELFAVELVGELIIGAEIEEAIWIDPDHPGPVQLAPLARDHVLPLARAQRRPR